jgi:hypothetical protein
MASKRPQIRIKRPGAFTKKAKAAGMKPGAFANKVMSAKKGKYSPLTRKQANFAKVFGGASHRRAGTAKAKAIGRKAATTRRRRG